MTEKSEKSPGRQVPAADKAVGAVLEGRRRALQRTQESVASALGIRQQLVQKMEAGEARISIGWLLSWAVELNTSVIEVLREAKLPIGERPDSGIEVFHQNLFLLTQRDREILEKVAELMARS